MVSSLQSPLGGATGAFVPVRPVADCLSGLLSSGLVVGEDWSRLEPAKRQQILSLPGRDELHRELVGLGLLTEYQVTRLRAGKSFGLRLGNFRVLDCLGRGGMGVVYLAEHVFMRRQAAVKVLAGEADHDSRLVQRFLAEVRAVGQLNHPNIVTAFDAGEVRGADPDLPVLRYFVMELVAGLDLEALVARQGRLAPPRACDVIRQAADALAEAHRHGLVHRDLKPSNLMVTADWHVKLLDFGLARQQRHRQTEPGTVLGTLGYMAPEQAEDSSAVDVRADVYSLGCTLYLLLTGKEPFPAGGPPIQGLLNRMTQPPPAARAVRADLPAGLSDLVARMMAVRPDDRPQTAEAVVRSLLPHLSDERPAAAVRADASAAGPRAGRADPDEGPAAPRRVLLVDDCREIRAFCRLALRGELLEFAEAGSVEEAVGQFSARPFDLLLLDLSLDEGRSGVEVLRHVRAQPKDPNLKVVLMSGQVPGDEIARLLAGGADDYLTKPLTPLQLRARVKAALRLKAAQDRSDSLHASVQSANLGLGRDLAVREAELLQARNAMVLAMTKLVEQRSTETGSHLLRMQRFCRILADSAASDPAFDGRIAADFPALLENCAPLHDIGKVALPDHILLKPGRLDAQERLLMQAHATLAADTLEAVARHPGFARDFLMMAVDVARHHHERWDGAGYPDHLAGDAIPLSARILAVADVYDALRSRRVYKPALTHATALRTILEGSPGQFDPALLGVFRRCAGQFERVYAEFGD